MLQVLLPTLQQIKSLQFSWILTSSLRGRRKKGRERGRENSTKEFWLDKIMRHMVHGIYATEYKTSLSWSGKTRDVDG